MGAPHLLLRLVEGVFGEVELELELAPRPEYGLVKPLFRADRDRWTDVRGSEPDRVQLRSSVLARGRDDARAASPCAPASASGSRCSGRRRRCRRRTRSPAERVAERIEDTIAAWRSWEAEHDIYQGPHRELVRLSSRVLKGLTYRPTGAIVAAPTMLAAGDGRRRAQLGLPLLLDPRREPDDRGAVHRRVLGRGGGVRVVHDQRGRRSRERALAADHVRDQRRARSLRARAAASARLARLGAGPGRQRRVGTDPARRLRRAAQLAATSTASSSASCIRRSSSSSPTSRTRPRGAGARPTPGCGRCAASRATTSPRRCCAGSRSIARSSSRSGSGCTPTSSGGRASGT